MAGDTAAQLTTSQQKCSIGDMAITVGAVAAYIQVSVNIPVYSASQSAWVGLYDNTAAAFVAWGNLDFPNNSTGYISLKYKSGSIAATTVKTYSVYFGSTNATAGNVTICKKNVGMSVLLEEITA